MVGFVPRAREPPPNDFTHVDVRYQGVLVPSDAAGIRDSSFGPKALSLVGERQSEERSLSRGPMKARLVASSFLPLRMDSAS